MGYKEKDDILSEDSFKNSMNYLKLQPISTFIKIQKTHLAVKSTTKLLIHQIAAPTR